MKISKVKKMKPIDRFLYFVKERWSILSKRRNGYVKPWTDDEILQKYYFTNVRREDDKTTIWVTENIVRPMRDTPGVIFAVTAFRWFNLPQPTGEYLLNHGYLTDWNTGQVIQGLMGFQNHGLKVFTGAFNISNGGSTKPKINQVCEGYIQPFWEAMPTILRELKRLSIANKGSVRLQQMFTLLHMFPGLGGSGFMAAQIVCDLAFTRILQDAPDWDTWCSWGPGSKRGMNRVSGFEVDHPMPRNEWNKRLIALQKLLETNLDLRLNARDVQNCLCEFSKYEGALFDYGHLKRRYPGAKAS